ncbi:T-cell surface glycoprotein CD3 epsilon chain [Camelus dromedarius]|uniref:T-cell surface glycoprotein CD3 epsilon chain n=1 Tax=Camelus dromedarius TaxID=9838 RepID=A0A5N4C869_CAMDR|nr:T-cell surface glycoprotein CD3 epsilon chain [Camelus dromedarius]
MPSGNLWRVLGLCLLSVGTWGQEDSEETAYKVSISGNRVELTCPEDFEPLTWEKNNQKIAETYEKHLLLDNFSEMENSGYYTCSTKEKKSHRIYLKARGQNRERPPPVPNPDYEPIRKGQRDLYSGLNQRGI